MPYQNEQERIAEAMRPRLQMRIIEARGIKAGDIGGTSDPFVEMRVRGTTFVQKTNVVKKTVNPFWNEDFNLYVNNIEQDFLDIKVYDFNSITNNELLGEIEFPVALFLGKPIIDEWRQLQKRVGSIGWHPIKGELKLSITLFDPRTNQTFGVQGGVMAPGVMPQAMPGAMPGQYPPQAMPGMMPGAMPGQYPPTMPGAMPGQYPGMMPGAMPGQYPTQAMPGQYPGMMPGAMPGQYPGMMPGQYPPGMMPGYPPMEYPGQYPGMMPGAMPGMMPGQYPPPGGYPGYY